MPKIDLAYSMIEMRSYHMFQLFNKFGLKIQFNISKNYFLLSFFTFGCHFINPENGCQNGRLGSKVDGGSKIDGL